MPDTGNEESDEDSGEAGRFQADGSLAGFRGFPPLLQLQRLLLVRPPPTERATEGGGTAVDPHHRPRLRGGD